MALSESVKKALANKAEAARKKGKKVTAGQLAQVYRKGLAAYKTGHRPGTTPNQWAMARVNSVLTGGKAAKVDAHIMKPKKRSAKS
jgi:cytochrome c553